MNKKNFFNQYSKFLGIYIVCNFVLIIFTIISYFNLKDNHTQIALEATVIESIHLPHQEMALNFGIFVFLIITLIVVQLFGIYYLFTHSRNILIKQGQAQETYQSQINDQNNLLRQVSKEILDKNESINATNKLLQQQTESLQKTYDEIILANKELELEKRNVFDQNLTFKNNTKTLIGLAQHNSVQNGLWEEAIELITQTIAITLNVNRVSIWFFNDACDELKCVKLYDQSRGHYEEGLIIDKNTYQEYFDTVLDGRNIIANDARNDFITTPFTETYFKPLNIFSLLDNPIFMDGKVAGVVCCEQCNEIHKWTLVDVTFTQSAVDIITVAYKTYQKELANNLLQQHRQEIERKNLEITDSINYARRIQNAILPSFDRLVKVLPDIFCIYYPKDIVSGDFYWFAEKGSKTIIATVDCTGHGVPGAFMSMIANDLLNQIVHDKEIHQADLILETLHKMVVNALTKDGNTLQDGMDIAICIIDNDNQVVYFSGAMTCLYYIENQQLTQVKGDKLPIGGTDNNQTLFIEHDYTLHQIPLKKDTMFYMSSDGYQDQFGGPNNKKFTSKKLRDLLTEVANLPILVQKSTLENAFFEWKGNEEQVDDVMLIGFRI